MKTYIVLLRGINVSGHKKIKMADLRQMLEKIGFQDIRTYIQSGNVVLSANEKSTVEIEQKIHAGIYDTFGFDVPVLVKSALEITSILSENPVCNHEDLESNRIYFVLLKEAPAENLVKKLEQESYPNEKFFVSNSCVYLSCLKGYGNAKLNNNLLEQKLKVSATTRNYKTMTKLLFLINEEK